MLWRCEFKMADGKNHWQLSEGDRFIFDEVTKYRAQLSRSSKNRKLVRAEKKQSLVTSHWRSVVENGGISGVCDAVDIYIAQVLTAAHAELVILGDRVIARGVGRYDNTFARIKFSQLWYVEKAANLARDLQDALAKSDAAVATALSFQLALLLTAWQVDEKWSVAAFSGAKIGQARQGSAAKFNAKRHAKKVAQTKILQELANAIWAEHPLWSKNAVARQIWKTKPDHIEANESTIAKNIKKPRMAG
jgi:hypothetical protein